ncbi:Uncharacterised protein [Vibrio cholerae]|nr:Uncharacterised protein [Vibrio cholerae]CSI78091.1 Uncharacterised protein [Vibrio cholerae]
MRIFRGRSFWWDEADLFKQFVNTLFQLFFVARRNLFVDQQRASNVVENGMGRVE